MVIHTGVIQAIADGDIHVDSFGNVFAGGSWIGKLNGTDLHSFLQGVVRNYFFENCRNPVVLVGVNWKLVIDGRGRIFQFWDNGDFDILFE